MLATVAIVAASLALARAEVIPSEPSPGKDFNIGGDCSFSWAADTTGTWGTTYVQLMTGPNENMVHLTTVYKFDGMSATETTHTFTCPDVTPHSAIYFYQFTSSGSNSPQWTGRFSISNNHDLVAPTNKTGDILWGTGALVDAASAVPAPPTAPGGSEAGANPPPPASSTTPPPTTPGNPTPPTTGTKTTGGPIPPANGGNSVSKTSTPADQASQTPADNNDGAASSLRVSMSALGLIAAVVALAL